MKKETKKVLEVLYKTKKVAPEVINNLRISFQNSGHKVQIINNGDAGKMLEKELLSACNKSQDLLVSSLEYLREGNYIILNKKEVSTSTGSKIWINGIRFSQEAVDLASRTLVISVKNIFFTFFTKTMWVNPFLTLVIGSILTAILIKYFQLN